jgi:hypothetical protein
MLAFYQKMNPSAYTAPVWSFVGIEKGAEAPNMLFFSDKRNSVTL